MYDQLLNKLTSSDQQHVLAHWDSLDDVDRAQLAEQVGAIDLALIDRLASAAVDQHDWAGLARRAEPPRAIRMERQAAAETMGVSDDDAGAAGEAALDAGEVGVLLVAGGQGTRLGFAPPKSVYPIGPISGASLVQIHVEKVRAIASRHGVDIPIYLMTSPATHEATVAFLDEHDNFGLPTEDLVVFCQGTMPAVEANSGKLLLAQRGSLFLSPDGHGGTVAALEASGAIDDAHRRGLKRLFYLQVDNPLVPICDSRFLGYHILCESEMSSLAIKKNTPRDKLGNFVSVDGRTQVIEYSDFPDDVAEQRDTAGELRFWAGSIAIHVFDVAFLDRVLTLADALPFHVARKKVPFIDADGKRVEPAEPNALKFERFIFDLLPAANGAIVVEAKETDVYSPLKNAPDAAEHTAAHVQSDLLALHRRWLEAAGAEVAPDAAVEISPLFALDERGVNERVQRGTRFKGQQYLV